MTRYETEADLPASLADLSPGDQIARDAVNRSPEQYRAAGDGRRLMAISPVPLTADRWWLLLVAPDGDHLVTASAAARGSADTEADRVWTVHGVGEHLQVVDATIHQHPSDGVPIDDPNTETAEWLSGVIDDYARHDDPRDEIELHGPNRLELTDPWGPTRATVWFSLRSGE